MSSVTPVPEPDMYDGRPPPPGAPAGGKWEVEKYIGRNSLIAVCMTFGLTLPLGITCDKREVYRVDGVTRTACGAVVPPSSCCGKPFGGPSA